jgi:hypothetical protein
MLARQGNYSLVYKRFRVIAKDDLDRSYFIMYSKRNINEADEYYWCRANQALKLGSEVEGYLCASEQYDKLPTLIVGECNSIIPSINRIAVLQN